LAVAERTVTMGDGRSAGPYQNPSTAAGAAAATGCNEAAAWAAFAELAADTQLVTSFHVTGFFQTHISPIQPLNLSPSPKKEQGQGPSRKSA